MFERYKIVRNDSIVNPMVVGILCVGHSVGRLQKCKTATNESRGRLLKGTQYTNIIWFNISGYISKVVEAIAKFFMQSIKPYSYYTTLGEQPVSATIRDERVQATDEKHVGKKCVWKK